MQNSPSTILPLNNDQKVDVLLKALEERYKALHIIRERVQNVCLWTLGLFITAGGWLLQAKAVPSCSEKIMFTIIIVVVVGVLRALYLSDLEKGFRAQQKVQAKIEETLGLCKPGIFRVDEIYPQEWAQAGGAASKGKFFLHNYILIYVGTAILIACLWFSH